MPCEALPFPLSPGLNMCIALTARPGKAFSSSHQFYKTTQVLWDGYVEGMKGVAFDADTDVYVASGLEFNSTGGFSCYIYHQCAYHAL